MFNNPEIVLYWYTVKRLINPMSYDQLFEGKSPENKTAYITKYALSKGIYKANGRLYLDDCFSPDNRQMYLTVGIDCFFTLEEAQAKVIEMAKLKKMSLNKQIAKMDLIIHGNPVKLSDI